MRDYRNQKAAVLNLEKHDGKITFSSKQLSHWYERVPYLELLFKGVVSFTPNPKTGEKTFALNKDYKTTLDAIPDWNSKEKNAIEKAAKKEAKQKAKQSSSDKKAEKRKAKIEADAAKTEAIRSKLKTGKVIIPIAKAASSQSGPKKIIAKRA